jgi:hypothetical protein
MKLAIKLYATETDKPAGIPDVWPSKTIEIADDAKVPDNTYQIMTLEEYNVYKATNLAVYNTWSTAYLAPTPIQIVSAKLKESITFGSNLIFQAVVENITLGITQAGKTQAVSDYCAKLQVYVTTGSLYAAMDEIDALIAAGIPANLSPFITIVRLNAYKSKILAFLTL